MSQLLTRLARRVFCRLPKMVREPLIRQQLTMEPEELRGVTVSLAQTVGDYLDAARLVHAMYVQRGLIAPHPSGLHLTPQLLWPSTHLFVAKREGRLLGTLSLTVDSERGLPMDKVYPGELAALRARDRKLSEVGTLCIARDARRKGLSFLLNKLMWRCASELLGVDDLLAGVVPEAACVYEAVLRFERMPPKFPYAGVQVRGVGMRLDLRTAAQVLRHDFGSMPRDDRNPYHLYVERSHPQILMPDAAQLAHTAQVVKPFVEAQLLRLRAAGAVAPHAQLALAGARGHL